MAKRTISFGMTKRLVISFVSLLILSQFFNYFASRDLRVAAVNQREIDKVEMVANQIGLLIKQEEKWVETVGAMVEAPLQHFLEDSELDSSEVSRLLDFYLSKSNIDVLEVTNKNGIVINRTKNHINTHDIKMNWGVEEALSGKSFLVSSSVDKKLCVLYVMPIWRRSKVIGTLIIGKSVDAELLEAMGSRFGARLDLVSRNGVVISSSGSAEFSLDSNSIRDAFEQKIPVYRSSSAGKQTQVYMPQLIVDDGWVIVATIDSSSAIELIERGNYISVVIGLIAVIASILLTYFIVVKSLRPLNRLRITAEQKLAKLPDMAKFDGAFDDIKSIANVMSSLTHMLQNKNDELVRQQSDLRISAVAFESGEAMMITDAELVVLRINRAYTRITGYTEGDVVGYKPKFLGLRNDDKDFFKENWAAVIRSGGWQGQIWGVRKNGQVYPKLMNVSVVVGESGQVTNYIFSHVDITEQKKADERIERLAFYDPLTELPNRKLLMDRLKHAMASSERVRSYGALVLLDIDFFKFLNDTKGHEIGDLLLKEVASRISNGLPKGVTVSRIGGDEFIVVLENLGTDETLAAERVEAFAEELLNLLGDPFSLNDLEHRCTASIGISLFLGTQSTIAQLLSQSDLAMYKAKELGRNRSCFFDQQMQSLIVQRNTLENELRQAVIGEQFVLYFQPQVNSNGSIIGAEVLLRWNHPGRGLVMPSEFIRIAEETGLILQMGEWVITQACRQLSLWQIDPVFESLGISVNVSAKQVRQPEFVVAVMASIEKDAVNAQRLKLELTESILVENVEEMIGKMLELKAFGVRFALDDFGTGYSSLSYLKRLPLEQLKIDRSFVRDILSNDNDFAIAETIVVLARCLGLSVIAEGVEILEQKDRLGEIGCDAYQGYYFGRPMPIAEFESLVRSSVRAVGGANRLESASAD